MSFSLVPAWPLPWAGTQGGVVACVMPQGLENEYDRLLAEHDALKRRLARVDPSFQLQGSSGKKGYLKHP